MSTRRSIIFQNSVAVNEDVEQAMTALESSSEEVRQYINKVETERTDWRKLCKEMKENKANPPYFKIEPTKFDFNSYLNNEDLELLSEIEEFGKDDVAQSKKVLDRLKMVEEIYENQKRTVKTMFRSYANLVHECQMEAILNKIDPKLFCDENESEPGILKGESFLYIEND